MNEFYYSGIRIQNLFSCRSLTGFLFITSSSIDVQRKIHELYFKLYGKTQTFSVLFSPFTLRQVVSCVQNNGNFFRSVVIWWLLEKWFISTQTCLGNFISMTLYLIANEGCQSVNITNELSYFTYDQNILTCWT